MKTEIEAKFLHVTFDDIRAQLLELGAVCEQPMRLMRRALICTPEMTENGRDAFMRVRDEGDRVTLAFKDFKADSITGVEEQEVVISSFDDTLGILAGGGLIPRSYQETKRETWKLEDVEIVLDEWPWMDPYIEIEGPSEAAVKDVAGKLNFSWDKAVFGHVDKAYKEQYPDMEGRGVIDIKEVRFDTPVPENFGKSIY